MTGTMQPAGYWLEVLRHGLPIRRTGSASATSCRPAATVRHVRASDATAPLVGSGVGRSSISVQLTLRSPDGLLLSRTRSPTIWLSCKTGC
jgi:hypothetical protein